MAGPTALRESVETPRSALSAEEAKRRAQDLVERLRTRAQKVDADRVVSEKTITEINDAGLFRISAPLIFGGSQLGIAPLIETVAAIASGCGSTGWVYAVLTGHNWLVSLFPKETQTEIFSNPKALVASVVRLAGTRPKPVADGFVFEDAVGHFCSGIEHAEWIVVGTAALMPSGDLDPRYFLIPKREVEIVDDWFTSGLRGTRSASFKVSRAFVPHHRSVSIPQIAAGTAPGAKFHNSPVYRAPFPQILPMPLAGVPIGLGRAAMVAYLEKYRGRLANYPEEQVAEQSAVLARISEAHADVEAAAALILKDAAEIDATPDGAKTAPLDRARYVRNVAYGANKCRYAVTSLFESSGGSGIYDSAELQRIWRDANAAAAHNAFMRDRVGPAFGRAILGIPPSKFDSIGH